MLSQAHQHSHMEAVGVKVQLLDELGAIVNSTKFSLDPEITSFEMLQSLLTKAFDLKGEFSIAYLTMDDEEHLVQLSIHNDWDLDAAILNCIAQHCLKLIVQKKNTDEGLDEWDIVDRSDFPYHRDYATGKPDNFVSTLTDKLSNILGKKSKSAAPVVKPTKSPMTDPEFRNYMDSSGKLICEKEFRESIYQGGIDNGLRKVTWRHLLNVFPPDLNGKQRYEYLQQKSKEYHMLRDAWKDKFGQGMLTEELKYITSMVRKDVIRTDRTNPFFKGKEDNKNIESLFDLLCTYSVNHPDVSYCQGMSDIASVMLIVQNDEATAYICFCAIMKRLKANFMYDGKAMTCKFDHLKLLLSYYDPEFWTYMIENEVNDLFFTYRWLLLELKREFTFNDALYMLEVMWSTLPIDMPVYGLALSDIYCLSSDGTSLISGQQAAAIAIKAGSSASLGTPLTPTPYTKLLSLCRKPSNTPVSNETPKLIVEKSLEDSPLVLQHDNRLSDITSELGSVSNLSLGEPVEETDSPRTSQLTIPVPEPYSRFYLTVDQDENGVFHYIDAWTADDTSDAIRPTPSSRTHCNGSCSSTSTDSGIRTRSGTNCSSQTVSAELQFAFEASDSHTSPEQRSVFPPPDEFGYGNPFLMFAAYTMILQYRDHIIKNKLDFDSIVTLFDRKVRKNNVHEILHHTKEAYENYVKLDRQTYDC